MLPSQIKVLEARVESLPVMAFLFLIAFVVTVLAAYLYGYLPGAMVFVLGFAASALFSLSLRYVEGLKEKLQVEKRERLTNGEPVATFNGIRKFRVKSETGGYHDWEILTQEKEEELIRNGLLRTDPSRSGKQSKD